MENIDSLPDEWFILRQWLPEDLRGLAVQSGFFRRNRGLQDSDCWLRLILMHVAGGLSLKQTAVRARELGLANVSSVALHKRLKQAEDWLASLTKHVLSHPQTAAASERSFPTIRLTLMGHWAYQTNGFP
jgi:hypothetical protein